MTVTVFADAAATWAAIGALSTLLTAVIALGTAMVFTGRQTNMAERAATSAQLAADAAIEANKTAQAALGVANEQLAVAARETEAVERQTALALEALNAARRPVLHAEPSLGFDAFSGGFRAQLTNVGGGPGNLREAVLTLPTGASCDGLIEHASIAAGATTAVTFAAAIGPRAPAGRYEARLIVVNAAGADPRETCFVFRRGATDAVGSGARLEQQSERPLA